MNKSDTEKIETLGFIISSGIIPLDDFVDQQFSGLLLHDHLSEVDRLLLPLADVRLEKEVVYFENPPPTLIIQYLSANVDDDVVGLGLSQAFIRYEDELVAELDFLRLPAKARGQGISKRLLNLNLQQYLNMGVDKVRLEAALTNGGLVWAKAYFCAIDPAEVKVILKKAEFSLPENQYRFAKRIYDNYYNAFPNGRAFPMVKWSELSGMDKILNGSRWHGELDLKNSEILANFKNYVA